MGNAARCIGQRNALRWHMQRTALPTPSGYALSRKTAYLHLHMGRNANTRLCYDAATMIRASEECVLQHEEDGQHYHAKLQLAVTSREDAQQHIGYQAHENAVGDAVGEGHQGDAHECRHSIS